MGSTLIVIIVCFALAFDRGIALTCYSCRDIYGGLVDGDTNCRDNLGALMPTECIRRADEPQGSTPICFKVLGTISESETHNRTETAKGMDVVRGCIWVEQALADKCLTGQDGEPLGEFGEIIDGISVVEDINTLCVCSTDACNGVASLQTFTPPLVLAVIAGCGVVRMFSAP